MTSAEKIAELRQAVTATIAGLDRESDLGEQLFSYLGLWQLVPGFVRRRIVAAGREHLPVELLEDAAALDDLLGLLAGVALELRSDEPDDANWHDDDALELIGIAAMRERAREVLEQVRGLAA